VINIPLRNSKQQYGWLTIILHWLMAPMIVAMFILGCWMTGLDYYDRWYHDAPEIHKSIGMLLLCALLFRLGWRLTNICPQLMGAAWEQLVARLVHRTHYLLLLIITLTGYLIPTAEGVGIAVFNWFTVPATIHFNKQLTDTVGIIHHDAAWAAMALAGLHAAAAMKHHFIDRDTTLLRMLGIARPDTTKEHPQP